MRDIIHRGEKHAKRIKKFVLGIVDQQAKSPSLLVSWWTSPGPVESDSSVRQSSSSPPDGSIDQLPFSPLGSIAAS